MLPSSLQGIERVTEHAPVTAHRMGAAREGLGHNQQRVRSVFVAQKVGGRGGKGGR